MNRAPSKSFRDVIAWQKAHALVLSIYRICEEFPQKEQFVLSSQIRRAAISVPANIAEGFKKKSTADKARLLNVAQGSLEECRYYLILAEDLDYADVSTTMNQLEEVSKLLNAYCQSILNS